MKVFSSLGAGGPKEELSFGVARTGVALLHGHPPPAQPGAEQLELVLDRLWGEVLPTLQPQADGAGFGPEWKAMCETRTAPAALAAVWVVVVAAQTSDARCQL